MTEKEILNKAIAVKEEQDTKCKVCRKYIAVTDEGYCTSCFMSAQERINHPDRVYTGRKFY